MCRSIPILGDSDSDIFSKDFYFFRDSEPHVYDALAAERNYQFFLQNHVLENILIKSNNQSLSGELIL